MTLIFAATLPGHRCFKTLQSAEFPHCYQASLSGAPELQNFIKKYRERWKAKSTNPANSEKFRHSETVCRLICYFRTSICPMSAFPRLPESEARIGPIARLHRGQGPSMPSMPCMHEIPWDKNSENSENTSLSSNTCLSRRYLNVYISNNYIYNKT